MCERGWGARWMSRMSCGLASGGEIEATKAPVHLHLQRFHILPLFYEWVIY